MQIKLLRNPSVSFGCTLQEGESGEVDASLGQSLVSLGIALELPPKVKPEAKVKGVAKAPAIAKAAKPVIAESKDNASE
jgi:hypothetical protein